MSIGHPTGRRLSRLSFVSLLVTIVAGSGVTRAQWVTFVDETSTRLSAAAENGSGDVEEKDYAWGDVDNDGDIDLVVVRKQPWSTTGKRTNVLFINEGGVLVDRTDLAIGSDVPFDSGFLTPTNDRDVVLVDVDMDGWLDMVTAVTLSDGSPQHIGYPRVYMNRGESLLGDWLGFRYESGRIPAMLSYQGQPGDNPRFCSVAAGDVTGDGYPDLYFSDYDTGEVAQLPEADFNDRLLVNDGNGFFTDVTTTSFDGLIPIAGNPDLPFEISAFGASAVITDLNGDGFRDIVKQTALTAPQYVGVGYNNPDQQGTFDTFEVVNQHAPYFVNVGDLNNDTKLDLVVTDDGLDRYQLNQGNAPDGTADFLDFLFSFDAASDDGFGGNSVVADLNNDGWKDVLIADVDVDIPGCARRLHIYRNLGGQPGDNVILQEQTTGTGCETNAGNPPTCLVGGIPADRLEGVHDVAVFDIDGDNQLDLVIGRCNSTEVYMNRVPAGVAFSYPQGLPARNPPGEPLTFQVQVSGYGGAFPQPGSTRFFVSTGGGGFTESPLVDLGGELYEATLPATPCAQSVEFYFTAEERFSGEIYSDPPEAPSSRFSSLASFGTAVTLSDGLEGDTTGWTVTADPSLETGQWEVAVPNGTIVSGGGLAAPDEDAEAGTDKTHAFVTQNGAPGGEAGVADVDGGPTDLISPSIHLANSEGTITYSRWFYSDGDDTLTVWVTNDGSNWQLVETVDGSNNSWQVSSFRVGEYVTPTDDVQVRFSTGDSPNDSITEAAVDRLTVEEFLCQSCAVPADCDDGQFCNGVEQCNNGGCAPGADPCAGQLCDEASDSCVECVVDAHCDDGRFCTGTESCVGHVCVAGTDPCTPQLCDDVFDVCVDCLSDGACDDGVFCNGAERCTGGQCVPGGEACPGRLCDEETDLCVGNVALQPRMGDPLPGLTGPQLQRFQAGREAFRGVLHEQDGLGPIFNQNSCSSCHNNPVGGSGSIMVTRFGLDDPEGGGFDPLTSLGGSLLQSQAIDPGCAETVPLAANVTAQRLTPSTLGFGLVEAVPDAQIESLADNPPPGISGRATQVTPLEAPAETRVGRFGWKSQIATVLSFSADAAREEMGLTNRLLTQENAPNGDLGVLLQCDMHADPEDGPDAEGLDLIDRVTDFERYLAPPPQTPRSGMSGEIVFFAVGCTNCHAPLFTTSDESDSDLEDALRAKTLRPYSDFLLHDMGQAADFIEQGGANAREMRTPPLWGLRTRDPMWHDGRVAGGTLADRVLAAISEHAALGSEAAQSAQTFLAFPQQSQSALIAFLDSLGRMEFDQDGDNDVDAADHAVFLDCFTGPGSFYTPDDACSISDADQDGDVDEDDASLFLAAADVPAGRVPDGAELPGAQLTVGLSGGQITLAWGPSCNSGDSDYEVYKGTLRDFTHHTSVVCSTAGTTSATFSAPAESTYFLIVPANDFREGSYGSDSNGLPRPAADSACLPQAFGGCL